MPRRLRRQLVAGRTLERGASVMRQTARLSPCSFPRGGCSCVASKRGQRSVPVVLCSTSLSLLFPPGGTSMNLLRTGVRAYGRRFSRILPCPSDRRIPRRKLVVAAVFAGGSPEGNARLKGLKERALLLPTLLHPTPSQRSPRQPSIHLGGWREGDDRRTSRAPRYHGPWIVLVREPGVPANPIYFLVFSGH